MGAPSDRETGEARMLSTSMPRFDVDDGVEDLGVGASMSLSSCSMELVALPEPKGVRALCWALGEEKRDVRPVVEVGTPLSPSRALSKMAVMSPGLSLLFSWVGDRCDDSALWAAAPEAGIHCLCDVEKERWALWHSHCHCHCCGVQCLVTAPILILAGALYAVGARNERSKGCEEPTRASLARKNSILMGY